MRVQGSCWLEAGNLVVNGKKIGRYRKRLNCENGSSALPQITSINLHQTDGLRVSLML